MDFNISSTHIKTLIMKLSNQFPLIRTFVLGLIISAAAMMTSCAPKYGCYYGMTDTPVPAETNCEQEAQEAMPVSVAISAVAQ
jgi:hypothetical protein